MPAPPHGAGPLRASLRLVCLTARRAVRLASWLGLCPDNRISGGRILKAKTRKVTNRIANILRLAASAVSRANDRMGEYVRRFKGRLGKAEGIVAGAHIRAERESQRAEPLPGGCRRRAAATSPESSGS